MIWHKVGQWAWASDCGRYTVSASKLDDLRYGYTAWVAGKAPQSLLTALDAQTARDACERHARGAQEPLQGATDELNFGEQEVQR